jgi:1,4-dihydroxy-2-naphthoyl-CoA hydrolase
MAIWMSDPMSYALDAWEKSLVGHLGIVAVAAGEDWLTARMSVDERTRTPAGHLHGGAAVALAETVAGWAGSACVDPTRHQCAPLDVSATHLRVVADGHVEATARPLHLGERTQVWDVAIASQRGVAVCAARVTLTVIDVPAWH